MGEAKTANGLATIANLIYERIVRQWGSRNLDVFLAGRRQKGTELGFREHLKDNLEAIKYGHDFDVHYPEDWFKELVNPNSPFDLLSLENRLADSVTAVVIIVESPGSFSELGAFANNSRLRKKLIVLNSERYRESDSFVTFGPIQYLQNQKRPIIYYSDPIDEDEIKRLGKDVATEVRKLGKSRQPEVKITNLIAAQHFLLAAIYVCSPVKRSLLISMFRSLDKSSDQETIPIVTASINILKKRKKISQSVNGIEIAESGVKTLKQRIQEPGGSNIRASLDKIRLSWLNESLRYNKQMYG